jgi:endonuclease/exonuclease/phosphatase (EEP) superfamily protein YafD
LEFLWDSRAVSFDNGLMRRLLAAVLALAATACTVALNYTNPEGPRYVGAPAAPHRPASRPFLRIDTFNVEHAHHPDGAAVCLARPPLHEADVVLLQEMDAPGTEKIATALGLGYVYYPANSRRGEPDMGNAILSPWPIDETRKLILPHTSRIIHRQRIATIATVTIDGTPVRVYSLHLTSPFGGGGGIRRDQAEAVLADIQSWDGPVIVGGDCNSRSVGKRFEAKGFVWLTKAIRRTVGRFTLDHVFVRGLPMAELGTEAEVVRTCRGVSDHWPVVTRLGELSAAR